MPTYRLATRVPMNPIPSGDYGSTGAGGYDYLAVKFSPDGEELWRYQTGTEQDETFRAVTVDGDDNVYLGGGLLNLAPGGSNARQQPVVHKVDGASGARLWTYIGGTSADTTFRGVAIDERTGLVVCAGLTDGVWALQSPRNGGADFAMALLDSDEGGEVARWHGGSNGSDVFTFAGVGPDGSVTLAGYTHGDWAGGSGGGGADFAAVQFSPLERELLVLDATTPAPSAVGGAVSRAAPTTEAPTSSADVNELERATETGGDSGGDDWVAPVAVGAAIGLFVLGELCGRFFGD